MRRPVMWAGVVAVWVSGLVAGFVHCADYATTAGPVAASPAVFPTESQLGWYRTPTVIAFVHPECPCTRASLSELEEAARNRSGGARIVIVVPHDSAAIAERVSRIDDARIVVDPGGHESARFGATTSGYMVMYDRAGLLRFAGGITASRGHVGLNVGRIALRALLDGASAHIARHPVFGCALEGS